MERPSTTNVPEEYSKRWQKILDIISQVAQVPAALIMKFDDPYLEVLVSSKSDKSNPYEEGDREKKYGLYCEMVIENQESLDIPNALLDPKWKTNPDTERGMINYFGIPINWPTGDPFGTICILDRKERNYSETIKDLLIEYGRVVENHLELIYQKIIIEKQNKYINSINAFLPICSYCRKIRTITDEWITIEEYVKERFNQATTHGICPDCMKTKLSE